MYPSVHPHLRATIRELAYLCGLLHTTHLKVSSDQIIDFGMLAHESQEFLYSGTSIFQTIVALFDNSVHKVLPESLHRSVFGCQ